MSHRQRTADAGGLARYSTMSGQHDVGPVDLKEQALVLAGLDVAAAAEQAAY